MSCCKLVLLAALAWIATATLGFAASSNVNSLTASSAVVGTQLFYCPIGASTDLKCTAAQIAAYNYSLMSGDCTASGSGAITCTKTSGTAFSGLATLAGSTAGDLAYYNGTAWARFAGNASGTQFLSESASGVPAWSAGSSSVTFTTSCPTTSTTGSTIPLTNGANVIAESSAHTILASECGAVFEVTGTTSITMPTIASGFEVTLINQNAPGGATVTAVADAGHTIGNNGASSIPLLPGQSVGIAAGSGATPTNWDLGPGAGGATTATGPGYVTGQWYYGANNITQFNSGSITTTGTAYCSPYWLLTPQPSVSGGGSMTLGSLALHIVTGGAGTTTATEAVYNDAVTGGVHRPDLLLGYTPQAANTTANFMITGTLTAAFSGSLSIGGGLEWFCTTTGDSTGKYNSQTVGYSAPFTGNSSVSAAVANTGGGVTFPITYGASAALTWPTDVHTLTFSESTNVVPFLQFQLSSVP